MWWGIGRQQIAVAVGHDVSADIMGMPEFLSSTTLHLKLETGII